MIWMMINALQIGRVYFNKEEMRTMLKNILEKSKKRMRAVMVNAAVVICMVMLYSNSTFALQNSVYVTGTKKLAEDLLSAIQIIAIPVVLALIAFWALKRKAMDDQGDDSHLKKMQAGALITLILIETLAPLIKLILGYYNISV